jgi:hypothetical protein
LTTERSLLNQPIATSDPHEKNLRMLPKTKGIYKESNARKLKDDKNNKASTATTPQIDITPSSPTASGFALLLGLARLL